MRTLRRPRVFAAFCVATALFSGAASLGITSGTAETPAPSQQPPAQVSDALELTVAPERAMLTRGDTDARFTVLLRNSSDRTLPEGSIELSFGERLTGESALIAGPDDDPDPGAPRGHHVIATAPLDALPAGKEHRTTVAIPLADIPALTTSEHGVYPVYANYLAGDAAAAPRLTATTPLVWEGPNDTARSVKLSMIVPLTLPREIHSMPTRAQLGDISARLDRLVDYATRTKSMLAIDPRIVTAIRGYGDQSPQAAQDLLERLERTQLPSFLLQFADADPAAQAALGRESLLTPTGLEFITRFGSWEPNDDAVGPEPDDAAVPSPTAAPGPDAELPAAADGDQAEDPAARGAVAPTLKALSEWPEGLPGAWPAGGQADAQTLSLLRAEGLSLTVLRSDNVALTGGPRAKLGTDQALVTDAELDEAVRLVLSGSSETERALGKARAAARLVLAAESGTEGIMLGVDRGGVGDAERPDELLQELVSTKWVDPVEYTALPEGAAKLRPAPSDEDRIDLLREALGNEATVLETRAILVNPEYLDSYQRMRLLSLLGTRYAAPDAEFARVARAFAERDDELHGGVEIVGTKRAQLVGGSTRIPIQLRNSLPFDTVVTLTVAPTSAALLVSERSFESVALPEESIERVLVPTRSRLSSGDSALLLTVTSVDGAYTASESRLEVAISSSVETVAIVLLAGAAALLFGFGIWRSLRRRHTLSPRE